MKTGESDDASSPAVAGACFCHRITILPTKTRILILQHPREHHVPIGTARMAHRALPNSTLRVGVHFAEDAAVRAALADSHATYVLFPGPGAEPVEELPPDREITIVVLDGTWSQARKLLRLNPSIAALPRVAFRPLKPSAYAIRREPADHCVSTIEALAEVLNVLEPEGGPFERLLDPFHAMVERQVWFRTHVHARRHHFTRRVGLSPRNALAARLTANWSRLVCVHGEANAWPRDHPVQQEPETVHWVAHRPATTETFEAVMAPRQLLGPATHEHIELSPERLRAGASVQQWHDAWKDFTRPDDILVMWGTYYRDLAASDGLHLPFPSLDLRVEASRFMRRRFGGIESSMAALDAARAPIALPGRGGRRLAALVGALESLRCVTPPTAT
jgi:DTW domain-containing protein YfiP